MDFDDVLNLEEQFYQQGIAEGKRDVSRQQYNEGKQYGYQTSFQRFVILGYYQGIVESIVQRDTTKKLEPVCLDISHALERLPKSNTDADIESFGKTCKSLGNKMRRLVYRANHDLSLKIDLKEIELKALQVCGTPQTKDTVEEMW